MKTKKNKLLPLFCVILAMILSLSGITPVIAFERDRDSVHVMEGTDLLEYTHGSLPVFDEVEVGARRRVLSPLDEGTFLTEDGILMVYDESLLPYLDPFDVLPTDEYGNIIIDGLLDSYYVDDVPIDVYIPEHSPLIQPEFDARYDIAPHWAPSEIRITFHGNGHTGGSVPATQIRFSPTTFVIPGPGTMVRTGYAFNGWRCWQHQLWQQGQVRAWHSPQDWGYWPLTAQWVPATTMTFFFNGNGNTGGTPPANIVFNRPGSARLPGQNTLGRGGFTFGGWRSGNTLFNVGDTVSTGSGPSTAMAFMARWNINNRPIITAPEYNNMVLHRQAHTVRWSTPAFATGTIWYTVAMRNLTTWEYVFPARVLTTNSITIPAHYFTSGHRYRIAVSAGACAIDRRSWRWYEREFRIECNDAFYRFYATLNFRYPLNHSESRHISSGYRLPGRSDHEGIDIQRYEPHRQQGHYGAIINEPVFSAHSGSVLASRWCDRGGWWVAIGSKIVDPATHRHIVSRYMHMRNQPLVPAGRSVLRGTQIGNVGNTGVTFGTGPNGRSSGHLHLDFNNHGVTNTTISTSINPERFYPQIAFTGHLRSRVTP